MNEVLKQGMLGLDVPGLERLRGACEEAGRRLARLGVRFKYSAERNEEELDPQYWPSGNPDFYFSWQIGLSGCSGYYYANQVQGNIEALERAVEREETSRKGDAQ